MPIMIAPAALQKLAHHEEYATAKAASTVNAIIALKLVERYFSFTFFFSKYCEEILLLFTLLATMGSSSPSPFSATLSFANPS
ncbi:hypothetical protein QL285_049780 [Trifolium repens]|nr:hypothetical protein QL285_049780 [Trifolium repens]